MRPKGSKNFSSELQKEIIAIYRKVQHEHKEKLTFAQICKYISVYPASRFYLHYRAARNYCNRREQGEQPSVSRNHRSALLEAFYDLLTIELRKSNRYDTLRSVFFRTLNHPAPSLGLSPRTIQQILASALHLHKYSRKQPD